MFNIRIIKEQLSHLAVMKDMAPVLPLAAELLIAVPALKRPLLQVLLSMLTELLQTCKGFSSAVVVAVNQPPLLPINCSIS